MCVWSAKKHFNVGLSLKADPFFVAVTMFRIFINIC